jgi:predicted Zn-dependent peptidase
MPEIHTCQQNGIMLVGERDTRKMTAGLTVLLPAGPAQDPPGMCGASWLVQEYLPRGCEGSTGRALLDELDGMGVAFQLGGELDYSYIQAACLPQFLTAVIRLLGRMFARPTFPPGDFEALRRQACTAAMQRDENPARAAAARLQQACLGARLGSAREGDQADLVTMTHAQIVNHHRLTYRRGSLVIAVAGDFDWDAVRTATLEAFADLPAGDPVPPIAAEHQPGVFHYEKETSQVHIGFGYSGPALGDPAFDTARLACIALFDGMGSPLFQRVRDREGLAYQAGARLEVSHGGGAVLGYLATTEQRAQEALDTVLVLLSELPAGISAATLETARLRLKMLLVSTDESTMGRSLNTALIVVGCGRARPLAEALRLVDAVSLEQVNDYLAAQPARQLTVVTVGPRALEVAW